MTANPSVVCHPTVSLDGFVAGPRQTLENPLGEGAERLHRWMFEDAEANQDEVAELVASDAFIMGRNMFGPIRGEWTGDWRGWWGDEPPYHAPVFVLTHHPRDPLVMQGGTTFTFVTDGIESALEQAKAAAGGGQVAIAGGASTVNQYLRAGLVDEIWLAVAPVVLGSGERLFEDVGDLALEPIAARHTRYAMHLKYRVVR
ncbi:MAG TPA: dihydrofolate reductase family protein [Actinomycetales bacterium]|nr:dihydrofolate reductase family protein [Actinomycetales bacterium]